MERGRGRDGSGGGVSMGLVEGRTLERDWRDRIGVLDFACFPPDVGSHGTDSFPSRMWDRTGRQEGEAKFCRPKRCPLFSHFSYD